MYNNNYIIIIYIDIYREREIEIEIETAILEGEIYKKTASD